MRSARSGRLSLLFLVGLAASIPCRAQDKLALVGGMLLDGYDAPPLHHAVVLVDGGRVSRVGRIGDFEVPADFEQIDTRGRTILPGLIDLHAHLMILGHGEYGRWFEWLAEQSMSIETVMEIAARQLLMAGVTTAVELGAPTTPSLRVRDRIASGEIAGPRLLVSGAWVAARPFRGFPEAAQNIIRTPEEAAEVTDALARRGVDVIKAWAGLEREHYEAIVEVAHRHGIQVHAHLYSPESVRDALDAGVDVLQHVGSAGTPPYSQALLSDIVVSGRPVVPTGAHRVWVYPATLAFPERLQDPRLLADFPAAVYEELQASLENFHRLPYFRSTPRQMFFGDDSMSQWLNAGAVIGMGTDSGTPMNFHTEALWREMKAFVDLGMRPAAAISAATKGNAEILDLGGELGTIEPGKIADIIVVRGNPLESIMALDQVVAVVKEGAVVKSMDGS